MKRILFASILYTAVAAIFAVSANSSLALQAETGVQSGTPAAPAPRAKNGKVSFKQDLIPLFRDNCTMCHQVDTPMGALALTPDEAYENLVGISSMQADMLRVTPGHPDDSYLYYKTSGKNALVKGNGIGMPWASALSHEQVQMLRDWIEQGAKNN